MRRGSTPICAQSSGRWPPGVSASAAPLSRTSVLRAVFTAPSKGLLMRHLPVIPPSLVRSAYRATGLRPAKLIQRQGGYACPIVAMLLCLGSSDGAGGDPIQRLAPPDTVLWWRGFVDGWDFDAATAVIRPEVQDGLYRLGRGAGSLARSEMLD